jgi:NAD(P)-dependent dehydrogenase (short-subunit alcohol dehydrogenase family)
MMLDGKVVVVTGGFGTLGVAVGLAAVAQGAKVALLDRASASGSDRLPNALSSALLIREVDLTGFDAAKAALAHVVEHFGGLNVLANVAGAFRWQTLDEGDLGIWDSMYTVNLKTAVATSKAALPYLRGSGAGRIINIGAGAATKAGSGMGAYAASKAGIAKLTESLAEELKDQGITVNAVLPSIIDTPANRADMSNADFARWVPPAELTEVIIFLASDAARAITGALLPVSGRV